MKQENARMFTRLKIERRLSALKARYPDPEDAEAIEEQILRSALIYDGDVDAMYRAILEKIAWYEEQWRKEED